MTKIDLENLTIKKAHDALKACEYSVRELVDAYLANLKKIIKQGRVLMHICTFLLILMKG